MKLIIDIPDHLYNVIKNKECTNKNVLTKAVENGTPLDDLKAEIEEIAKDYDKFADYRRVRGLWIALEILNNIGKADFPQAEDIEPTVKNFSKMLDNKLISNAIEEERCSVCGGVKRFGICQDCGSDM